MRGHVRVRGEFYCSAPQYGRGYGGDMRDTHTQRNTHRGTHTEEHTQRNAHRGTHTGTYTRMLHLPFSDLPLKKCPILLKSDLTQQILKTQMGMSTKSQGQYEYVQDIPRSHRAIPAGPTLLPRPTPKPPLGPDLDPLGTRNPPYQVKIRASSGPNQVGGGVQRGSGVNS